MYFFGDPFEVAGLVDDALEQPLHRRVVERTEVRLFDVAQHFRLARRLVDRDLHLAFQPADLERARGARVQQLDQRLVEQVDAVPQIVEVRLHDACPFSQRT